MWLVVCQDDDVEAHLLAERLRLLELAPVEIVSASQLVYGARWEHRVGSWGAHTVVRLGDDRVIDSADVTAVVNRLAWLDAEAHVAASCADREYAGEEIRALALSWLHGFGGRALNRPTALGLCGRWRSDREWRLVARRAGIGCCSPPGLAAANRPSPILVIDGEAVFAAEHEPPLDAPLLAAATGLDAFSASFRVDAAGRWELADVDVRPNLSAFGDVAVEAVARALRARSDAPP
jgi:hypothetical protein